MPSFTVELPNMVSNGPVVEVHIAPGAPVLKLLTEESKPVPEPVSVVGMIDTGATTCVFSKELELPERLGIKPVGVSRIHTPSSENVECFEYPVTVAFQNSVRAEITALEAPLRGQRI